MGGRRARWAVEEKSRIVELTLEPGVSVARVAQAEGVNANQVFQWRSGVPGWSAVVHRRVNCIASRGDRS
ncbi:MAG: transposase [Terracidiphilus sp.]|jgi:hypothetical protein